MYSFDNFPCALGSISSALGSISSALPLPVSRGRHRKLVDNFSPESDVTSLQDPFTSRPYETPFYFDCCVPRKIRRCIIFQIHVECSPSPSLRLLVSALAVYATAFRSRFPCMCQERRGRLDWCVVVVCVTMYCVGMCQKRRGGLVGRIVLVCICES